MANLKAIYDERASLFEQAKAVIDKSEAEARNLNAEEKAQYDKLNARMDELTERIKMNESMESRAKDIEAFKMQEGEKAESRKEKISDEELEKRAFHSWILQGNNVSDEYREIVAKRAQSTTAAEGGYTIAPQYMTSIIEEMKAFGGVLAESDIIQTDGGQTIFWATNDDTANTFSYVAEGVDAGAGTELAFGQVSLGAHVGSTGEILMNRQLLQDSFVNVEAYVREKLAVRTNRGLNKFLTDGTGTGQPQGLLTGAANSGLAPAAAAITSDNLIDLQHSIDPAYRNGAKFMFNDSTLQAIRKLKDSNGMYLWQPSYQAGVPDLIAGVQYVINQDMPSIGSSAKSVLFGNFREAFKVRIVRNLEVQRLVEKYARNYQVAVIGFLRHDAKVVKSSAVKFMQHAV